MYHTSKFDIVVNGRHLKDCSKHWAFVYAGAKISTLVFVKNIHHIRRRVLRALATNRKNEAHRLLLREGNFPSRPKQQQDYKI